VKRVKVKSIFDFRTEVKFPMSYQKILVDSPKCSRRFHISYDDQAPHEEKVVLKCSFCDATIFSAEDHPPVTLARQENLTKTTKLSMDLVPECHFQDRFKRPTT